MGDWGGWGGGVQKGIKQLLTTQQAVQVILYELMSIPSLCWKTGISRKGLGKKRELKKVRRVALSQLLDERSPARNRSGPSELSQAPTPRLCKVPASC